MKKTFALVLAFAMILSLAACGGGNKVTVQQGGKTPAQSGEAPSAQNEQQPAPQPDAGSQSAKQTPGDTYAAAYTFYTEIVYALGDKVNAVVDANNERLETEKPDDYYQDPSYMIIMYMPFLSIDMAFTANFGDAATQSSIEQAFAIMGVEGVNYEVTAPGEYRLTYDSEDWQDPSKIDKIEMRAKYDASTHSLWFAEYENGEVNEFMQCVDLGNDRYAFLNRTNRAVITYKDGEITELCHSSTLYEEDWETGELSEWSLVYDPEADSIYGNTSLDESWVKEHAAAGKLSRIYELKDGSMTVSGTNVETDWETGEESFVPMGPVTMPA